MIALIALTAAAQDYIFPTSAAHYPEWYPTAYKDHGGYTDWNCGGLTYGGHGGSDYGAGGFPGMDAGRDILAGAEGTVTATNDGEFDRCTSGDCAGGGGFGNYVYVAHPDGKTTIYGHLKQWSVAVAVGDVVTCGQYLGQMGSSGYSTGPHLHFQVNGTSGYSEDPFDGPCSAPPTYWVSQGPYAGLPGNTCGSAAECVPVAGLTCGEVIASRNDGAGSTSGTWNYGCTEYTYSGPELSWTFLATLSEPVTLSLTGLAADLDVYVVGSNACNGSDCIASSSNADAADEVLAFDAAAGVTYTFVVDGWEGAVSDFSLQVACAGAPPAATVDTGAGTEEPPEEELPEAQAETPVDPDAPEEAAPRVASEKGGCRTAPGAGWLALAGVAALSARRRRR